MPTEERDYTVCATHVMAAEVKLHVCEHSELPKVSGVKSVAVMLPLLTSCELVTKYAGTPDHPDDAASADDVGDAGKIELDAHSSVVLCSGTKLSDRIAPEDSSAGTCLVKLAGTYARVTYDDLLDVDRFETRDSVDGATPDPYDVFATSQWPVLLFDALGLPCDLIVLCPYDVD